MTDVYEQELTEQRYEWQPTDAEGRPLGNKQVILWRTHEEFATKFAKQNENLLRELRKVKRNNRLGISEDEEIPKEATRFKESLKLNARDLTAEERLQFSMDLQDPEKIQEVFDKIAAARFGAAPADVGQAVVVTQNGMTKAQVQQEVDAFLRDTPEYYTCAENYNTIVGWMARHSLEPTRENFKYAFTTLNNSGILIQAGGVEPSLPVAPAPSVPVQIQEGPDYFTPPEELPTVVEPPAPPPPVQAPAPVARISTGLSGRASSTGGAPVTQGSDIQYTIPAVYEVDSKGVQRLVRNAVTKSGLQAVDNMPPDEYKRRFQTEPGFAAKVDALEKTRLINRNQR